LPEAGAAGSQPRPAAHRYEAARHGPALLRACAAMREPPESGKTALPC